MHPFSQVYANSLLAHLNSRRSVALVGNEGIKTTSNIASGASGPTVRLSRLDLMPLDTPEAAVKYIDDVRPHL
jgi:hypothetical protein